MVRKFLLGALVVLAGIQFIRPEKNRAAGTSPNTIQTVYSVPADVQQILDKACLDCHSNNTRYPWYNNLQPVAWWIDHHVDEGKRELNFDAFASYSPKKQHHKMEEIGEQVKSGEMPMDSYTWMHKEAVLTPDEKAILTTWAGFMQKHIAEQHQLPPDKK